MNELINKDDLQQLDDNQLLKEFKNSLSLTVFHLQKMAVIWDILTNRGIDLSEYKKGLIEFVPLIAQNKLIPEFVTDFAGQRNLINHVSRIPVEEQRRLLKVGKVEKLTILEDGAEVVQNLDLNEIKSGELYQIFGSDKLRTIEDQRLLLIKQMPKSKPKKQPKLKTYRKVSIDNNQEYLVLGSEAKVKLSEVLELIKATYNVDIPKEVK